MKERILWLPTLVILMTPVAIAVACMFLEVWWKTWGDLANGIEPTGSEAPSVAAPRRVGTVMKPAEFSRRLSHSL